jgi:hypothetical protein
MPRRVSLRNVARYGEIGRHKFRHAGRSHQPDRWSSEGDAPRHSLTPCANGARSGLPGCREIARSLLRLLKLMDPASDRRFLSVRKSGSSPI